MRWVALGLLLFFAGSAVADGHGNSDVKAIEQLYADWREAVETSDIPRYLEAIHPDVRLLPPGAPAIVGRDAYGEFLKPVFAMATYKIDVDAAPAVEVMGELAVAEYTYTIHLDRKDDSVTADGGALTASRSTSRYFDVLRKDPDGKWHVWRHGWQQM